MGQPDQLSCLLPDLKIRIACYIRVFDGRRMSCAFWCKQNMDMDFAVSPKNIAAGCESTLR